MLSISERKFDGFGPEIVWADAGAADTTRTAIVQAANSTARIPRREYIGVRLERDSQNSPTDPASGFAWFTS